MKRILFSILLLACISSAAFADKDVKPLALGSVAPDFKLPGTDGRTYTLKDFADAKYLLVIFTCNHCPTAQYYEDRIKKLVDDYKPKGVAVVAIQPNDDKAVRLDELGYTDLNDSLEEMKIRAEHKQFNFPYLYDGETQAVTTAYGPQATPHAFLFDAERKLQYVGRIDDSERIEFIKTQDLRAALDALTAGKEIAVKQTKTFGCSIKWADKRADAKRHLDKLAAEPVNIEPIDAAGLKALRKNPTGKLLLINFWATWCGPCVSEFPDLITINRMYRHRAFEMVTVAAHTPDEKAEALAFLKKQQSSGRNLMFGGTDKYELMEAFDPDWMGALPYTLLLSPEGHVIYKEQGTIDPLELKRAIVRSLKEDRFK
ncbi:MAG TPA: redoxin family protein [Blastocatellia bacterium]|nr:redoxin family protein [Blastocatellia bacterium]